MAEPDGEKGAKVETPHKMAHDKRRALQSNPGLGVNLGFSICTFEI